MSYVCTKTGVKPSRSTSIKNSFVGSTRDLSFVKTILCIPLDLIDGLEDNDNVPCVKVLGQGVEKCFLERGRLKILAPTFSQAYITYGVFYFKDESPVTGSVISEMGKEGPFFVHELKKEAVMVGTIYLS